jgi:cathepsin O
LVKAQKNCGACWAYSTLGVIESINAIKSGYLYELSTSQMLECNDDDMNCKGGDTVRLLEWLLKNQIKIQFEKDYLASKADDKCLTDKPGIRIKDFSFNE